ncbi:RHE_PE00001 family protein (plasmid) [Aminobacter sp. UC22_36]|uniref:RHE_PE00001 family protein n=1 Tax=Aminobacter sp. UC22_36 TaxID=3374549 RepID=UPI003757AA42
MPYDVTALPLTELVGPAMRATAALVRLDERIARSPVGEGFVARCHFADAVAALWLDGELVHLEDLVLHDAHMDLRAPTHELTRAHEVLRLRRQVLANKPDWALGREGFATLCGRGTVPATQPPLPDVQAPVSGEGSARVDDADGDPDGDSLGAASPGSTSPGSTSLSAELAALDAALSRANASLDRAREPVASESLAGEMGRNDRPAAASAALAGKSSGERSPWLYDSDWDEPARLGEWQGGLQQNASLPPLLRAAVAFDAWTVATPLQHAPWLGRLLVSALLRQTGTTTVHLAALYLGARAVGRERRQSRDRTTRLLAFVDAVHESAVAGIKEHDRLILAKAQMERRLKGRRSTSKLPQLIELVLSRPLVSSGMIEKQLGVTTAGALNLIGELDLREVTGRGRYRAWGVM